MWAVTDATYYVHVYPTEDRQHDSENQPGCWCGPAIEPYGRGALVVHRDAVSRLFDIRPQIIAENYECAS